MSTFVNRLKERHLVQWALAYLAGAFGVLQLMDAVAEPLSLGPRGQQIVLVLLVMGFFITLVLAWFHGEKGRQSLSASEIALVGTILVLGSTAAWFLPESDSEAVPSRLANLTSLASFDDARPRIAVLPLASLSADDGDSYFAAGIHDELVRMLSLVQAVGVISRTSTLQYANTTKSIPEIASEIGARYIVEGTVQHAAGQVRVQVQLVDAQTDQNVWGDRYDETLDDIFVVQTRMAQDIVGQLRLAVTPADQERIETPPTDDPIAYDLYLRAAELDVYEIDGFHSAVALLRRATSLDTTFAVGHARLAEVFQAGVAAHALAVRDSILPRADAALRFDADLSMALRARGYQLANSGRTEEGRASLERALSVDPGYAAAWGTLAAIGWWTEDYVQGALAGRQGVKADRGSWTSILHLANNFGYLEMYREQGAWAQQLFALDAFDPTVGAARFYGALGMAGAALQLGDTAGTRLAVTEMRVAGSDNIATLAYAGLLYAGINDPEAAFEALSAIPESALGFTTNQFPTAAALLGWAEVRTGRMGGRERLQELESRWLQEFAAGRLAHAGISDLVLIASVLHDEDEQLRWFREAVSREPFFLRPLRDGPGFERIRQHPDVLAWLSETEQRLGEWRREMAVMGPWMPEDVLGSQLR